MDAQVSAVRAGLLALEPIHRIARATAKAILSSIVGAPPGFTQQFCTKYFNFSPQAVSTQVPPSAIIMANVLNVSDVPYTDAEKGVIVELHKRLAMVCDTKAVYTLQECTSYVQLRQYVIMLPSWTLQGVEEVDQWFVAMHERLWPTSE